MTAFKFAADQLSAYRIGPNDTNYFAILADEVAGGCKSVAVIEIFNVGGKTPPNTHTDADELFFVLSGEGRAWCNGVSTDVKKGDTLLVKPGSEHVLENTGSSKLYTLTVMIPDEGFGALIRGGTQVSLDAEDLKVLQG